MLTEVEITIQGKFPGTGHQTARATLEKCAAKRWPRKGDALERSAGKRKERVRRPRRKETQ